MSSIVSSVSFGYLDSLGRCIDDNVGLVDTVDMHFTGSEGVAVRARFRTFNRAIVGPVYASCAEIRTMNHQGSIPQEFVCLEGACDVGANRPPAPVWNISHREDSFYDVREGMPIVCVD